MDRTEAIELLKNMHWSITTKMNGEVPSSLALNMAIEALEQPEIIRCKECKHNPLKEWFGCPMAHLSKQQRPEDSWCWKGEREAE